MPNIESQDRPHQVVYWAAGTPGNYGKVTVEQPVQLDVRWRAVKANPKSAQSQSENITATATVNQDTPVNGLMWRGKLTELPTDLSTLTELYEIVSFTSTPDIKGRFYHREASLRRYRNTLPTVNP